ncbi:RNA polymerase factor sigma-54 [Cohnella sp. GCM10027633]|uniref:RNA polymerase factor sigma-54 n=1 Tax=unclassified Cohnella TaxID=2636738 RepID=UPI00362BD73F
MNAAMTMSLLPQLRCSLAPELRQSLKVLQMPATDLIDYVRGLEQDNPLVELTWTESGRRISRRSDPYAGGRGDFMASRSTGGTRDTLEQSLIAQLRLTDASAEAKKFAAFLAGNLNENGYLDIGLEEASACMGASLGAIEAGLRLLQSLEPAGVGARTLAECLLLQMHRDELAPPVAARLAETHLNDIAGGRWKAIARATGVPDEELRRAVRYVRSLDPRPGAAYAGADVPYVIPEAKLSAVPEVSARARLEQWTPRIVVHSYAGAGAKDRGSREWQAWLAAKSKEAAGLKEMVRFRSHALTSVILAVAHEQRYFLTDGPSAIRPLKLEQIAAKTGFHVSTVSRAVQGKFVDTPYGVMPLSRLFSASVASDRGGPLSARTVKLRVRALIAGEDKRSPLTDKQLADRLREEGMAISRRTVAKYREEERLLPSSMRAQRPID